MGIREDFLRGHLPASDPNVVVGRCRHTCPVRVNMGKANAVKIGMRSHYCRHCSLYVKHDLQPHSLKTRQRLWNALTTWDEQQKVAREVQRNRSKKGARAVDLVRRGKSAKEKIRASLQVDRCDGAIPPYPPLSPPTMPVEQTIPVKKRVLPLYTGWDSDDSEVEVVKGPYPTPRRSPEVEVTWGSAPRHKVLGIAGAGTIADPIAIDSDLSDGGPSAAQDRRPRKRKRAGSVTAGVRRVKGQSDVRC